MGFVRNHRETLAANSRLQQRIDQLREANWYELTDGNTLRALIEGGAPAGGGFIAASELITVSPYPAVTPAVMPLVITRAANGYTRLVSEPAAPFILRNAAAVRIDFQTTWTSAQNRRSHLRESSCVVCAGGLLR
jgi:hypothetical protein